MTKVDPADVVHMFIDSLEKAMKSGSTPEQTYFPMNKPKLLTAGQAAKRLGIDSKRFRELVADGKIGYVRVSKARRYTDDELDAYINRNKEYSQCLYSNPKVRQTGTINSTSKGIDITARLSQLRKAKHKTTKQP